MYLRSLRMLTNCLVIMTNVLLISENVENTSGDEFVQGRYVSYFIIYMASSASGQDESNPAL